jgi:glycine/D-amino acid oxidase-like deaminating enzyme
VIGCGVVGAMVAYELSQIPDLEIVVYDRRQPAQASTGAALGVLMGAISQKIKGSRLQMRLASITRYNTLIPELKALTGRKIPFNQYGILRLCFKDEDLSDWQKLAETRRSQGWQLDILGKSQLHVHYPHIQNDEITAAIYSPGDRQVDPVALTLALVEAAQQQGVKFRFGVAVEQIHAQHPVDSSFKTCQTLQTAEGAIATDWIVLAAGLGSTPLTQNLEQPIEIRPVLGQALRLKLEQPLGQPDLQPIITGEDIHLVPLEGGEYWVGATVEFAGETSRDIFPDPVALETVLQGAIAFCPALAKATIVQTWSGLRPRPQGRPAPIIGLLPGYQNVLLATGHYRNGVLLAPATAQAVRGMILGEAISV